MNNTTTTAEAAAQLAAKWGAAFTRAGITAATPTPAQPSGARDAPQPVAAIAARWQAAFRRAGIA